MKHCLTLALLLTACQPDQPHTATRPAANGAAPAGSPAHADTLRLYDSLHRHVGTAALRPSTKAAFDRLRATDPLPARPTAADGPAADAPLPADGRVQRQGETLVFRPAQGAAVTLRPVPSPDGPEGNDNAYYYWGSLPAAHQWVVDVATDEGPAVLLLDQRTGRRTSLLGAPSVSPDGRYLLSVCEDLASGGTPTALSLYRADGPAPRPVWTRDLTEWGPRQARWRDARHVVLEQQRTAADGSVEASSKLPFTYTELELPAER